MADKISRRIFSLLDAIKADFPRRKKDAEDLMKKIGLNKSINMKIESPIPVESVPTFDSNVSHAMSSMLTARFQYASTWMSGRDVWLSPTEMVSYMKQSTVLQCHRSLRENWDGSAPMLFTDDQLTLFGITKDVPENLTYLVWSEDNAEPEVWIYAGLDSHQFKNLELFFKWCLERE